MGLVKTRRLAVMQKMQKTLTSVIRSHIPQDFACKQLQQILRRCQENGFIGEL